MTNSLSRCFAAVSQCKRITFLHIVTFLIFRVVLADDNEVYPPAIDVQPENMVTTEGSSVTLNCSSRSNPAAQYRWLKDDAYVTEASNFGVFRIGRVSRLDQGAYRCIAHNEHGSALSATANISVAYLGSFVAGINQDVRVPRGYSAILNVPKLDAFPMDAIKWEWMFQNSARIYSDLTHHVASDGSLIILNAQAESAGQYSVKAIHSLLGNQQLISNPFSLTVTDDRLPQYVADGSPYIVLPPKDQTFLSYAGHLVNDLRLDCVASSATKLENIQLIWFRNETQLSPDGLKYVLTDSNRRLTIRNANGRDDSGVYRCEARVQYSTLSSAREQAVVQVISPPVIKDNLYAEISAELDQPVEIPCRFEGSPYPTTQIRWYFNGNSLENDIKARQRFQVNPSTGALKLRQVKEENAGIYQCEPFNAAGSAISSVWLPPTRSSPPAILFPPENKTVVVGQTPSVLLRCEASKPATVSWTFNGSAILIDNVRYGLDQSGIRLMNPGPEMAGWYQCIARNSFGTAQSVAVVDVIGKTQITQGPEEKSVVIGSNVIFPCDVTADGRGPVSKEWYFKGEKLNLSTSNRIELRPDGSLLIRQVGPSNIGAYTCEVTSAAGKQRQSARLNIVEKPGMPFQVRAVLLNDTLPARVEIFWHEGFDGNSPIIKFIAQMRVLGAQDLYSDWETAVESIGREQRRVVVDNLKPSATYEFRIVAVNKFGPGQPSVSSNRITMPQQPPASSPRNVAGSKRPDLIASHACCGARSSSSIMVQWQPPAEDQWNGDLLGYVIRYRLADYPDIPWNYRNISEPRTLNILLEDPLITWREYEIQVAAYNQRGTGVYSKSLYITTLEGIPLEAPSSVSVTVLNSTAVRVEWVPPPPQMILGVNLGYRIEAWHGTVGLGEPKRKVTVLPTTFSRMSANVSGLEKYTAYNVTVLSFTTPGDGPRSAPISILTEEDTPGPVENLHFDEVLFSSVILVWERPLHPNGRLLNYTLTYWVSNRTQDTKTIRFIDANATQIRIDGLVSSTRYTFDIFPATVVGRGPSRTATIESGVPPELPTPPTGIALSNVKERSVDIQFTPGYDGKTIISRWIVEALSGQNTVWLPVFNISAPMVRSFTVGNLRPFTRYTLRLIAKNVVGPSSPSEPTESFETNQAPPEYAPQDFGVEPDSASSTALKIAWTPLQSTAWNGVPKGYLLVYRMLANQTASPGSGGANGSVLANEGQNTALSAWNFEDATKFRIEDPGANEYSLQFLNPDTFYEVALAAYTQAHQGEFTRMLPAKTFEDVPRIPPSNVECLSDSSTTLRVRWAEIPAPGRNGRILGHRVYYTAENPAIGVRKSVEISGDQRNAKIVGLRPFTEYGIQVAAFTLIGDGPLSQPPLVIRTREDVPGPPSDVKFPLVTPSEVRLTWKPPFFANGDITHYAVEYKLNGSTEGNGIRTQLARDLRMFVASGLLPQTYYRFAVSAETDIGYGQEAVVFVFTSASKVPPTVPGRPMQSYNHPRGSDHVTLIWDVDVQMVAPVRFYVIGVQPVNSEYFEWSETIPGSDKHFTVRDLKPNTAYRFRLKAINDFGESRWSADSDWIKTVEAEPTLAPLEVRAFPFESQTAKILWKAPPFDAWNSDYIGYRILYKEYGSGGTFQSQELPLAFASENQTQYIISDLSRFKHYVVILQAFNRQGSSPRSRAAFVYVGFSVPKLGVTGLNASSLSSTELKVSWDKWNDTESISGFKVVYAPVNAPDQQTQEIVRLSNGNGADVSAMSDGGRNDVVLKDLFKYTEYLVRVFPFNRASPGEGPIMETKAMTMQDRPGPVASLKFSDILLTSVNVSWSPPKEPNGVIIGYLVAYETYKLDEEFAKKIQEKVLQNFLPASSLEPNVTYTFTVKAETVIGYGPPTSAKVTIGPQPGSPMAPLKPSIYTADDSATLQWQNTDPGRTPIIGYIIQFLFLGIQPQQPPPDQQVVSETIEETTAQIATVAPKRTKRQTVASPVWETLTISHSVQPVYVVSYSYLQVGGIYKFRTIARNENGVSFPSPATDSIVIPVPQEPPFYMRWYFIVILALVGVVVIVIVVAVLCVTGRNINKLKNNSGGSNFSLQLADGVIGYDLRGHQNGFDARAIIVSSSAKNSLQKRSNHYINNPPPRPEPAKVAYTDSNGTIPVKRMSPSQNKLPNLYDSLAGLSGGANLLNGRVSDLPFDPSEQYLPSTNVHRLHHGQIDRLQHRSESDDPETSTTGENSDSDDGNDKDVSSIAQHYATNDTYKLTWQRAKKAAQASIGQQQLPLILNSGAAAVGSGSLVDGSCNSAVVTANIPTSQLHYAPPPRYPGIGNGAAVRTSGSHQSLQQTSVASSQSENVSYVPSLQQHSHYSNNNNVNAHHNTNATNNNSATNEVAADNSGFITLVNSARSRDPAPGFSSFV